VPYQLRSSEAAKERREHDLDRAAAGDVRRGLLKDVPEYGPPR
jgi:hypothetical protein